MRQFSYLWINTSDASFNRFVLSKKLSIKSSLYPIVDVDFFKVILIAKNARIGDKNIINVAISLSSKSNSTNYNNLLYGGIKHVKCVNQIICQLQTPWQHHSTDSFSFEGEVSTIEKHTLRFLFLNQKVFKKLGSRKPITFHNSI